MKTLSPLSNFALMLFFTFFLSSCKDLFDRVSHEEFEKTEFAEITLADLGDIADQAYLIATVGLKSLETEQPKFGVCTIITLDTLASPRRMIIDYGTVNCLCRDGKYRRGTIIVTFTGPYRKTGTVTTHTFNEFFVNDNKLEGTRTVTNKGPNNTGSFEFEIEAAVKITLKEEKGAMEWNTKHLRTWIQGYNTREWKDDVYTITGGGNFNWAKGSVSRTIIVPLRKEATCQHFVSGTVKIVPSARQERLLDYGDGTCDNVATVTIGNQTYTIKLR